MATKLEEVKMTPIWTLPQELLDIVFDLVYPAGRDTIRILLKSSWQVREDACKARERRKYRPGKHLLTIY